MLSYAAYNLLYGGNVRLEANIVKKNVRRTTHEAFVARNKAVFDRIKREYKAKNPNQLSKKVEHLGIGRSTVYDWSRGDTEPSEEYLDAISEDTGKSAHFFLGIELEVIDISQLQDDAEWKFINKLWREKREARLQGQVKTSKVS
jgi:transcriptional regulator with XRE-family HTH domain